MLIVVLCIPGCLMLLVCALSLLNGVNSRK